MYTRLLRILLSLTLLYTALPLEQSKAEGQDRISAEVSLVSSDQYQVRLLLQAPVYEILPAGVTGSDAVRVQVPGIPTDDTPGNLRLPRLTRLVAIPPGVDIQLLYTSPEAQVLPGIFNLLVAGKPQALVEELTPGTFQPDSVAQINLEVDRAGYYPAAPVSISEEIWLRGQRLVRVDLFPFQYEASTARLLWHPTLEVTLSFTKPAGTEQSASLACSFNSSPLDELVEGLVINPDSARLWRNLELFSSANIPLAMTSPMGDYDETRYKITTSEDGLYEVTGEDLNLAGMDLTQVNPQLFSLSNQGSPVAIQLLDANGNDGEADGVFDGTDRVVFYGEGFGGDHMAERYAAEDDWWEPMPTGWQPHMSAAMFEKYTAENVYWLDVDGPPGLRMSEVNGIPTGNFVVPLVFNDTVHIEEDNRWYTVHRSNEDTWFWDRIAISPSTPITRTYSIDLPGLALVGAPAVLWGEIYSDTENTSLNPDHHIRLRINNHPEPILDGTWDGVSRYSIYTQIDPALLLEGSNHLELEASLLPNVSSDRLYIDWFELSYPRSFQAQSDQLFFNYNESGVTWNYRIDGFTSEQIDVLDISNPLEPVIVQVLPGSLRSSSYQVEFQDQHPQTGRYLVNASPLKSPLQVSSYTFKNLHATNLGADYLIITHADFAEAAQTLANYRSAQGLRSLVVDLDDIINEFNDGIYHSLAIKSFLAYTMANWVAPAPAYVVLVGSGHWNFFGRPGPTNNYSAAPIYMPPHLVWVDPWQGEVDSATALAAVVGNDNLPDLAIGRIPVDTPAELQTVIGKIISFEQNQAAIRQKYLLFVADNQPDLAGDFMDLSEVVIRDSIPSSQVVNKIYLNNYLSGLDGKTCTPSGAKACPEVNQAIIETLNNTAIQFINYTGHGSINYWATERLLVTTSRPELIADPVQNDLVQLNNSEHQPVLLSMTCLDGYWIYPSLSNVSLAVNLLRQPGGGIAAAYSPTGLGVAHGHDILNRAFFDAMYEQGVQTLGGAVAYSKLALFATGQYSDLVNTYTIFGDPAMRLVSQWIYLPVLSSQFP